MLDVEVVAKVGKSAGLELACEIVVGIVVVRCVTVGTVRKRVVGGGEGDTVANGVREVLVV